MNKKKFKDLLTDNYLTGKLNRNHPESNRQAVRELIARNSYWTFDMVNVAKYDLKYDDVAKIMAQGLGLTPAQFESNKPCYIDPNLTINGLIAIRLKLEELAAKKARIIFTTAHPGSMLGFFQSMAEHYQALGGKVVQIKDPVPAPSRRWLDQVGGVIMLSDEGNLMHAHVGNGFIKMVKRLKPDAVFGDHGMAMAAINAGVYTMGIFDVDDPALPLMQHYYPKRVLMVPMNDNQTNLRTTSAAEALWDLTL